MREIVRAIKRRKVWEASYVCVSLECSPPHLRQVRTTVTMTKAGKLKAPECPACGGPMVELLGSRKLVGHFIDGEGWERLPHEVTT